MNLEFSSELASWQVLLLAGVSFGVGILGGFVGLALGTMRLPALILIGVSPTTAAGTNILVSTLSAIAGGYRHFRERRVDWRIVGLMGVPTVIGSFAGGFASSSSVPEGLLVLIAGVFVSWQSVELVVRLRGAPGSPMSRSSTSSHEGRGRWSGGKEFAAAAAGLVVGLVGGAVGLILGSVRLPFMIRLLGVEPRMAIGSNLAIGTFMGAFGFIGHGVQGEVDLPILLAMGATGMVGSYIGAQLTGRVSLRSLLFTMSAILFGVGILLIRDGVTRWLL